jgi:hypothetical protein
VIVREANPDGQPLRVGASWNKNGEMDLTTFAAVSDMQPSA